MAKVDTTFDNTPLDPSKDKGDAPSLMQGQIAYLYKNKTLGITQKIINISF